MKYSKNINRNTVIKKKNVQAAELALARFCSYQDRTLIQVRDKLKKLGIEKNEWDKIILKLTQDGFLDEERYARSYVSGKFRLNKWGRLKIIHSLQSKGISTELINKAFNSLGEEEYRNQMKKMINDKYKTLEDGDPLIKKHKVARFMFSKGFENSLIWEILNDL